MRKILATKAGWLIGVEVLKETPKLYIVKEWHENREHRIFKNTTDKGLFDSANEAIAWITK